MLKKCQSTQLVLNFTAKGTAGRPGGGAARPVDPIIHPTMYLQSGCSAADGGAILGVGGLEVQVELPQHGLNSGRSSKGHLVFQPPKAATSS